MTWKTNEAYNDICITRTVEMTALSFNKKNMPSFNICLAFGEKKLLPVPKELVRLIKTAEINNQLQRLVVDSRVL